MFKGFDYSAFFICIVTVITLTSCSTPRGGVTSPEIMRPLSLLHKAVNATLGEAIKGRSPNSRTYYSTYHAVGMDLNAGFVKKKERGQLIISVLGDRRPYTITVVYQIESLSGSKFQFNRYDKGLAKKYLDQINEYLASRPEGRDVIDGFRPY